MVATTVPAAEHNTAPTHWLVADSMSIVSTITVDKGETSLKWATMEKLGLDRSLTLLGGNLEISEIVTDAHVQIAAFISRFISSLVKYFYLATY